MVLYLDYLPNSLASDEQPNHEAKQLCCQFASPVNLVFLLQKGIIIGSHQTKMSHQLIV